MMLDVAAGCCDAFDYDAESCDTFDATARCLMLCHVEMRRYAYEIRVLFRYASRYSDGAR